MGERTDGRKRERPLSRRQFLTAVAVGAGTGGIGALLLGDPPKSDVGEATPEPVAEAAHGVPESEFPYPVWQYHHNSDGNDENLAPASPINVVFPLEEATFEDVTGTVEAAGWTDWPLEYTLWAWNRETRQYERPDWSSAETVLGLGGRLHIRAWHVEGTLSFQAHVDSAVVPRHEVTSYADARTAIEEVFEEAGWSVGESIALENRMPPDHDGQASVIRR